MNPRRVLAILDKDARDALRDGRILVALLVPLAVALFSDLTAPDADERPVARVAVVEPARAGVAAALERVTRTSVELERVAAADAGAARRAVGRDDADVGVVVGPVTAGAPPRVDVLLPPGADAAARTVAALVPAAVAAATGRPPVADVRPQLVPVAADAEPAAVLGPTAISLATAILLFVGFVGLLIAPITIAEELETGTFGALRLAATTGEVLAAKVLNGLLLGAAGLVLTLLITGERPDDPVLFFAAALALALSLIGFGLVLGVLSRNANQINTFAGFLLVPVLGAGLAVLFVEGGAGALVLDVLPFSQATRLLLDALAPEDVFGGAALSWLVVLAWTLLGFALLARLVGRREL